MINYGACGSKPAGEYQLTINREGWASGIYFLKMEFGTMGATAKLMIR